MEKSIKGTIVAGLLFSLFSSSLFAANDRLQKSVVDLATRVERMEQSPVSNRGLIGGFFNFASHHPIITATVATALVCYSKRSRSIIRTSWGWMSAGAERLFGKNSWTVAGIHAIGFVAAKAESLLKEVNGESAQETVLRDMQQQLKTSADQAQELQQRLSTSEELYKIQLQESAKIKDQLGQTANSLQEMTAQLTAVQQDGLTAQLQAQTFETNLVDKYDALEKNQQKSFVELAQMQQKAIDAIDEQMRNIKEKIGTLKESIKTLTNQVTTKLGSHAEHCAGNMATMMKQVAQYEQTFQNLEKQEQKLQQGLQQLLSKRKKSKVIAKK
jgi:chromosome segregation ATPase